MKRFFILSFMALSFVSLQGQNNSSHELIRVRAGDDPRKTIPFHKRYRYKPFQNGHVLFSNGRTSSVYRFNYDFLFGEMRLIKSPAPDTLFVVNDASLKYVFIGDDIFYHDPRRGYILLLAEAHSTHLGVRYILKKKRNEASVNTGYGLIIDYTSAIYSGSDIMLERRAYYYFITENDFVLKANSSNLMRAFPDYRGSLETYLDTHPVRFNNESDLTGLFLYCSKLP